MQQSPRPEVNQAAATAEHPAILKKLRDLVSPIRGAVLAGNRDEKDEDRLEEKMAAEDQSPRTVRDYSGFRIAVDSPAAHDAVADRLRQRFEVPNEQDEFETGDPETGFHGHTLQVREPGSPVSHEVQVLPREVAEAADDRHALYEKAREGDADAAAQLKQANEADWQKFQARNAQNPEGGANDRLTQTEQPTKKAAEGAEPKFKFGSTQASIPEDSDAAAALKTAREKIAPEDRAGDVNDAKGGLVEDPHVTVRYGIKGDDVEGIKKFLESQAPFEATLGKTDKFPASEHSDGAAPIIAPIDAPEMHRIQAELEQHGEFAPSSFPEYKPHATLGYVKPEAAEKYVGMGDTEGKKFTVNSIAISDRNGNLTEVPLKSKKSEGNSQESDRTSQTRKAPVPPDRRPKPEKWSKGDWFLVREQARGNYRAGEVTYFNEGVNGAKPGGRSRVGETKLDEIPRGALRILGADRKINPVTDLPAEDAIIERTGKKLPELTAQLIEKNTEDGVTTLATDAAKGMFPEFKADPVKNDRLVCASAKAVRDAALETVLAAPVDPKRSEVLIGTASPGSGKTAGLVGSGNLPGVGIKIEAIADDYNEFSKLIQDIVASGRKPVVQWVYVDDPAKTVRRMFLRAAGHEGRTGIGRTVQLKYMADAYTAIPSVLEQIREHFGSKVKILAVDNSGPAGTAKVTSDINPMLAALRQKSYNQVFEEMTNETRKLQSEGHFDSDRGKAILEAAQTSDPPTSDEAQGGSAGRGASGGVGSGRGKNEGPELAGSVLNRIPTNDSARQTAAPRSGRSVALENFKEAARRKGVR